MADRNVAGLHETLTVPSLWSSFANNEVYHLIVWIFQAAQGLDIPSGGNYHIPSGTIPGGEPPSPAQTPVPHSFEAIVGADDFSDAENHATMKDVLNEIVDVTRTVSPTCECSPPRFVEGTLLTFTLHPVGSIWGLG